MREKLVGYRMATDEKEQKGNHGFSGLETICSVTLLKTVSWIYFVPPVVQFSLTYICMKIDIDN